MNHDDAKEQVAQDMITAMELMVGSDMEPDQTRKLVYNVIDQYVAHRGEDIEAIDDSPDEIAAEADQEGA